ncbi:hypothetical protein SARC_11858 [Sphaeroforma arctica JP610]|uniref:Uncharacterized protein n=1 Tax=Sphaeroforma arctica JP610 TaxID=667725 RepID=A0A0L0FFS6_9EUKA|nr:hypothetical protein SARC_11858 [Sphaeroforma arctica JP610]KNC75619.1 hypothetical protein SARC_11858 [Sphaeroforma arctica JP610]|eukprot:XP_014149521.1 hypothetical protein SARC_11858 [Sphaeroforma arctica JP610]
MKKLNLLGGANAWEKFDNYTLVDSVAAAAKEVEAHGVYDAIIITLSSAALKHNDGDWCKGLGPLARVVVSLSPGPDDAHFMSERMNKLITNGIITFAAYPAPLGRPVRNRIEYLLMGPMVLHGHPDELCDAMNRGGLWTVSTRIVPSPHHYMSALFMPFLAILELNGWSFSGTACRPHMLLHAARSTVESLRVHENVIPSFVYFLFTPLFCCVLITAYLGLLLIAPWFAPFNLEEMFQYHFSKVRDQTVLLLDETIKLGREKVPQTIKLRKQLH